jgi:hypothetical protein
MPLAQIELSGLDAANLLGYLAALGTLRALDLAEPEAGVRLSWSEAPGWWMPVVHHPTLDANGIAARLTEWLGGEVNEAWLIGDDLTIPRDQFAKHARAACLRTAAGDTRARLECEFLAAFGSDGSEASGKPTLIGDTAFRTMSGAGHQHFLGFMRELQAGTTEEHIRAALFHRWKYADGKPSMRWDPNDFRPHALRAEDPASDPIRTVRGANRLAVEALPLFPTMPTGRGIRTTSFQAEALTYPVWQAPLDRATVASLLGMKYESWAELRARGVDQLFRTTRFTEGKYRNFSPSSAMH